MTIRLFYDRWPQYERRLVESIRDLTPEQLAATAVFLCSDAARQVRGAAWTIDGGWLSQ